MQKNCRYIKKQGFKFRFWEEEKMKSYSESYKAAGVDITAGYKAVELMKEHIKRTNTPGFFRG